MTSSTDWPRIGPARHRTTTQQDRLRREANPQVEGRFIASPQVMESGSRTLSRWRHGFEPRWDYERKVPGQGSTPQSIDWLNRDSSTEYPENIPSQIVPSVSSQCHPRIVCLDDAAPMRCPDRNGRAAAAREPRPGSSPGDRVTHLAYDVCTG
jgi:hypothetical protein